MDYLTFRALVFVTLICGIYVPIAWYLCNWEISYKSEPYIAGIIWIAILGSTITVSNLLYKPLCIIFNRFEKFCTF